jgi:hypothetical protein
MIKVDKRRFADGSVKHQYRLMDSYRPGPHQKPKMRTVKNFGYLEDQPDREAFLKRVREENVAFLSQKSQQKTVVLTPDKGASFLDSESARSENFGYAVAGSLFDEMDLGPVLEKMQGKFEASLLEVTKFLTITRLMAPDSKRASYQSQNLYYGLESDFSLQQLYRSLDRICDCGDELIDCVNAFIEKNTDRDLSHAYYDSTNFYFQTDYEDADLLEPVDVTGLSPADMRKKGIVSIQLDEKTTGYFRIAHSGLRKRGVSKEHSVDPIVQMGLMIDDNGIPFHMQCYPGNTADSKTMPDAIEKAKKAHSVGRITFVADKGMNCGENIARILDGGDDYLFSQQLRGKKGKRYHDYLFGKKGSFTVVDDDYKYMLFDEEVEYRDDEGKKRTRKQRVLIYWDGKDAARQKIQRAEKMRKAEAVVDSGMGMTDHSFRKYVRAEHAVKETGEAADKVVFSLDKEKAEAEAMFDGFFCLITSDLSLGEKEMRQTYGQLWRIEESFRVTKTDLIARPVFVWTEKHIRAHFIICYIALVILRMIENRMGYSLSTERLIRALNSCDCTFPDPNTVMAFRSDSRLAFRMRTGKDGSGVPDLALSEDEETAEDMKRIAKTLGIRLCAPVMARKDFDRYLAGIRPDVDTRKEKPKRRGRKPKED